MKGPSRTRFDAVFREGRRVGGRGCRVISLEGTGLVGIATSRKIGNSPLRNRAKRRFREGLRRQSERVRGNLDYVFVVTPQGARAPFQEIVGEIGELLEAVDRRWAGE